MKRRMWIADGKDKGRQGSETQKAFLFAREEPPLQPRVPWQNPTECVDHNTEIAKRPKDDLSVACKKQILAKSWPNRQIPVVTFLLNPRSHVTFSAVGALAAAQGRFRSFSCAHKHLSFAVKPHVRSMEAVDSQLGDLGAKVQEKIKMHLPDNAQNPMEAPAQRGFAQGFRF